MVAPKPPLYLKGKPLNYPAPVMSRYAFVLEDAVKRMTTEAAYEINGLFQTKPFRGYFAQDASVSSQARILTNALMAKFDDFFAAFAKDAAKTMVNEANNASNTAVRMSLREIVPHVTLDPAFFSGDMKEVFSAAVNENVTLIRSISSRYMTQVQSAVMRSITTGNGLQTLIPFLQQQEGIAKKRATFIAEDQTRKCYASLNMLRMQKAGVNQYEWLHSAGGQHPRKLHVRMSGNVYDITRPPVIDDRTGERGHPGQLVNCRCRAVPLISFAKAR